MSDKKINVLMVPSDYHGVGHFRNIWPAQAMETYNKDEFFVEINHHPNFGDVEYFKKFDIIHYHRQLGPHEDQEKNFKMLRDLGITLIMDIDDYWEPFFSHPLYQIVMQEGFPDKIKETIKRSDIITTTTSIFADEIRKINPNVHVIPNAVDPNSKMWKHNDTRLPGDDRCRIAWIGGSSHWNDLKLLEGSMSMLYGNTELKDKFQIILCGFDTRGNVTEIDQFGKQRVRPIKPHETVWNGFEQIFTNKYIGLSDDQEYVEWLKKIDKKVPKDINVLEKRYMRRWTLPLTQYAKHYDYCDVCLAPLDEIDTIAQPGQPIRKNENIFNKVKSELKIIEAGMKKKVLIAQDFAIYRELLEDGVNGLLVSKNDKGWYKAIRKVVLDKDLRNELANNLHEFVMEKYDIKNVNKNRVEFYKSVVKDKKAKETVA